MPGAITESHTAYSVEVSRRDNNQDFFVEKTELHWSEQSGKHIYRHGGLHRYSRPAGPVTAQGVEARGRDDWRPLSLDEVRKQPSKRVLTMCKGNRLRAAQVLGIGRTSLYRYRKEDGYDQTLIARSKAAGQ